MRNYFWKMDTEDRGLAMKSFERSSNLHTIYPERGGGVVNKKKKRPKKKKTNEK